MIKLTKKFKIAVFASGKGSNFENLILKSQICTFNYEISCLISNNSNSGAIDLAKKYGIQYFHISDLTSNNPNLEIENELKKLNIDFIILAGYLKKIGKNLIDSYPNRIINIHPAPLPEFGGKGMYGENLHRKVLDSGVKQTGITIHLVNEEYDKGEILKFIPIPIEINETLETLTKKIHDLEHKYYPEVINNYLNSFNE